MSNSISVEPSKPSAVRRLSFLPRLGLFIDVGGSRISLRAAPIMETILNMRARGGFTMKNFLEVSHQQLREIQLDEQQNLAPKVKVRKKKQTR